MRLEERRPTASMPFADARELAIAALRQQLHPAHDIARIAEQRDVGGYRRRLHAWQRVDIAQKRAREFELPIGVALVASGR